MPVYIALLRGVNVTGANIMKMDVLRALCDELKFEKAQTYIQSGNIVFHSRITDEGKVARKLLDGIEKKFGFRPALMLRSTEELREIVRRNPFAKRDDVPPNKLLVLFLATPPDAEVAARVKALQVVEELHLIGRDLYVYYPDGVGQSKLAPVLDRTMKIPATGRNWNTVTKLLAMAEAMEQ